MNREHDLVIHRQGNKGHVSYNMSNRNVFWKHLFWFMVL